MSLTFEHVSFGYRRSAQPVLDDISWEIPPGKTILLGPNGAGKSTLLALGANALEPQSGRVGIGELDPSRRRQRSAFRRAVGWMPQQIRSVPGLTAREQVAYAAWLKGLTARAAWSAAATALAQVDLTALADRKTATLSGGQLRRVGLAQVLAHEATVLLLDEPTVGLDPAQRARFRSILARLPATHPVVISTHQTDDLTDLFDQVVVLEDGMIRFAGSSSVFLARAQHSEAGKRAEAAYASIVGRER